MTEISVSPTRIVSRGERLFVQDLDSHNGTHVNYQSITKLELKPDDMIQVGETEISVMIDEEDPFIGNTIEGYEFIRRLGRGGEGTVYLANQIKLEREVAVKVLDKDLSASPEARKRFITEARTAATLNHTHLVGIYDIVEDGDLVFFSMEFMAKGSLADLALIKKKISIDEVLDYINQALEGLVYLHKKGLVHRDIKPANFMLDEDRVMKIGDFGIASAGHTDVEKGHVLGSPHFMSPEHIQGLQLDARSDLYSLGCTAFRLMAGMPPFVGSTVKEILNAHLNSPPPLFRHAVPKIKPKIAKILDRLLSKEPEKRYADAVAFKAVLENPNRAGRQGGLKKGSLKRGRNIGKRKSPRHKF